MDLIVEWAEQALDLQRHFRHGLVESCGVIVGFAGFVLQDSVGALFGAVEA